MFIYNAANLNESAARAKAGVHRRGTLWPLAHPGAAA
jgi:hypothetical protein